jgi:hypothetical protein
MSARQEEQHEAARKAMPSPPETGGRLTAAAACGVVGWAE